MKKCKKKYIKYSIYLMCVFSSYSCNSSIKDDSLEAYTGFDNEISKPTISIYQEKDLVISATADRLIKNEGEDAILIGNVISDFFDEEGKHISRLYSDRAIVEKISNNLTAFGNVKVDADSGKIFSNKILWDNQYKLISSNDSTIFIRPNGDVNNCLEFETDMDFKKWDCIGPWGRIYQKEKDR